MSIRRWQVHPDREQQLRDGRVVQYVSREALVDAMLDGATMVDRAGGVLTVLVGREPTDLDGEMLTTQVVVEWKDRTNAKEQPEQAGQVTAPPAAAPVVADQPLADVAEVVGDALDGAELPEEDLSEVPAGAR